MEGVKYVTIGILTALACKVDMLLIPIIVLVTANIIDYITGIMAAPYRGKLVNSYSGFQGIMKKICMWLLVIVGVLIDAVLNYTSTAIGYDFSLTFCVSIVVAVWLAVNELISILENMYDIGIAIPGFLLPLLKKIRDDIEDNEKGEKK